MSLLQAPLMRYQGHCCIHRREPRSQRSQLGALGSQSRNRTDNVIQGLSVKRLLSSMLKSPGLLVQEQQKGVALCCPTWLPWVHQQATEDVPLAQGLY